MDIELPEKRYYSIGEVADAFEVNPSLIRFWETEFSILNPKKNAKGNRKFTTQDIENLRHVYFLVKERGYTIEGVSRNWINPAVLSKIFFCSISHTNYLNIQ